MRDEVLVSICCLTYNHAPYIRQCLDGFIKQKTNFLFEVLIHDDASIDGTVEIIKEYEKKYPNIIKPIYEEENQWKKGRRGSAVFNFPRAKGKYIAMCEGDDYWIESWKLQAECDILEKFSNYGCVYTDYITVDIESNPCYYRYHNINRDRSYSGDVFFELLKENFPQTLTCLFRRDLLKITTQCPYVYDYSLFLAIALQSDFYYLPMITGAYRINPAGLVQTGALWRDFDSHAVRLFYINEFLSNSKYKRSAAELVKFYKWLFLDFCCISIMRTYKHEIDKIRSNGIFYRVMIPLMSFVNSCISKIKMLLISK